MNKTYNKWLKGSLLATALVVGAVACTDDHFDVVSVSGSASQTIWENVSTNGQMDSLANLLSRIKVMRTETDSSAVQTYAEYLNQSQSFTLFAPIDGTYDEAYDNYIDMLDRADAYAAAGQMDSAIVLRYTVANQFAANHIALFNYESAGSGAEREVRMRNSKVYVYEVGKSFNNVPLDPATATINASNGAIHGLSTVAPFYYNIYEYLAANSQFSTLYGLLSSVDEYEFNSSASVAGGMNNDGEMEYIDSVYTNKNEYLDNAMAQIKNEDSLYIAIIPTDEAWEEAYEKLYPYFKYASSYKYDWSTQNYSFSNTLAVDADSLQRANAIAKLMESMYISASYFNSAVDKNSFEELETYATYADSLLATNRTVYLNLNSPYAENEDSLTDIDDIMYGNLYENPIFAAGTGDWYETSNGLIYGQTTYNVDPRYTWLQTEEMDAKRGTLRTQGGSSTSITLSSATVDSAMVDSLGGWDMYDKYLSDGIYSRYTVSGSSSMYITIQLPKVYSGTYKVSIVMMPSCINSQYGSLSTYYSTTLGGKDEVTVFTAEVLDDQGNSLSGYNAEGEYSNDSGDITVDSIGEYVLFDRLTFDRCYMDLPDDTDSFPRLYISLSSRYQTRVGNCKALNIVKVILEPYRGEE